MAVRAAGAPFTDSLVVAVLVWGREPFLEEEKSHEDRHLTLLSARLLFHAEGLQEAFGEQRE